MNMAVYKAIQRKRWDYKPLTGKKCNAIALQPLMPLATCLIFVVVMLGAFPLLTVKHRINKLIVAFIIRRVLPETYNIN